MLQEQTKLTFNYIILTFTGDCVGNDMVMAYCNNYNASNNLMSVIFMVSQLGPSGLGFSKGPVWSALSSVSTHTLLLYSGWELANNLRRI